MHITFVKEWALSFRVLVDLARALRWTEGPTKPFIDLRCRIVGTEIKKRKAIYRKNIEHTHKLYIF